MAQNLVDLDYTADALAVIDAALTALEAGFAGLLALTPDQRQMLVKMGDKSEAFCRQALTILSQNPQVVPPSLSLPGAQADLAALDQLRPRLQRLQRLTERASDSELALGSDVMNVALQGYALLKVVGKNQGLEALRKELGARFVKAARQADAPEPG